MTAFTDLFDLASERLGGSVIDANDEFFAEKENLLKAAKPVFLEHEYTDRGKWMDGWETRRKRTPGHDWCLVRLGLPGVIRGFVVDTAFFRGNYPDHCSIEGCVARSDTPPAALLGPETRWVEILPKSGLKGDSQNFFEVTAKQRFTHLRLNIFPDGGVARLRVHGEVSPDWKRLGRGGAEIDLVAVENGGQVLTCSDMFFGVRHNLIMPGRAVNMGDGWETKRRRGPGYDWALLELCGQATIGRIEVDTNHFKGNFPDTCMIEGCDAPGSLDDAKWHEVLPRTKLLASTRHHYDEELVARGPFTHLRLNIYPDGGVSRLRVHGTPTEAGRRAKRLAQFDALSAVEAEHELRACCGSNGWAAKMTAGRPFGSLEALLERADALWKSLEPTDWLEAFRAHPKIGEKKAERDTGSAARGWAAEEQAGVQPAADATLSALAEGNRAYEAKFGHIFIVCATGKSAEGMLENLRARLSSTAEAELRTAAEEQRKITRIRLEKLFT